jgi:hypothetical protein
MGHFRFLSTKMRSLRWLGAMAIGSAFAAPSAEVDPIASCQSRAVCERDREELMRRAFISERTRAANMASLARSIGSQEILQKQ